jgi:hypothetical protein
MTMFTRVLRSADAAGGGGPTATGPWTEKDARAADPKLDADLGARYPAISNFDFEVNDDVVRNMLDDVSKFLWQLAHITSGVLGTIDISAIRKIVAENAPMPDAPEGRLPDSEQGPDRDHRKNPRGRKHPLITLVQFALQGVRMLLQVTAAVHPNVHGKESLDEQKHREALKEQQRTFNRLLSGKL